MGLALLDDLKRRKAARLALAEATAVTVTVTATSAESAPRRDLGDMFAKVGNDLRGSVNAAGQIYIWTCPVCSWKNGVATKFCHNCGCLQPSSEKGVKCECGEAIPANAKFCPNCGKEKPTPVPPEKRNCVDCRAELPEKAKWCPECGKKQEEVK